MEVILLEKIERLGSLGDVVRVKPGYARNYLIPSGKAKYATEANMAEVQAHREELERKALEAMSEAEQRKAKLDGFTVTIKVETHQEGKLFGSVGAGEIARSVTEAGGELDRHEIRLPDGPLRSLGEHPVLVHLHTDVETSILVNVESSGEIETPAELKEEEQAEASEEQADDAPDDSPDGPQDDSAEAGEAPDAAEESPAEDEKAS